MIEMNKKTLRYLFIASLMIVLIAELFTYSNHEHVGFWWEEIPGFYAVYGFLGCVLIVIVSKALGHHLLQREEDYYEHD